MTYTHTEPHPLADKTVTVDFDGMFGVGSEEYHIEDWWDLLTGGSWMDAAGNPACIQYAIRSALKELPVDDEVVYGKIGGLGYLVHVSEIEEH